MAINGKQGSAAYPAYKAPQGTSVLRARVQQAALVVSLTGLFVAAVVASLMR